MEPKRELERSSYSGLTQAQQKRANENRILLAKSDLSADAVLLYFVFTTRQNAPNQRRGCLPNGGCCPTTQSLQRRMGNSKSRFYSALKVLKDLKLVSVESGKGSGKGGRNIYLAKWWHEWPQEAIEWFQGSGENVRPGVQL